MPYGMNKHINHTSFVLTICRHVVCTYVCHIICGYTYYYILYPNVAQLYFIALSSE